MPFQTQPYGFGLSGIYLALKLGERCIAGERCNSKPAFRKRLANPPSPGPAGFDLYLTMDCWRNHAYSEYAGKQLQPLDLRQGNQRACVSGERQSFGGLGPSRTGRPVVELAHRTVCNSSSISAGG